MKMHFGQLLNEPQRREKRQPSKTGVPSWIPPVWIIPLIDKESPARKKPPKDERPAIEIQIDERNPPEREPECPEQDDRDRGVVIIDLRA